jgi:Ca-activated chloride channel family protein
MTQCKQFFQRRRRGTTLILICVLMVVLVGMVAFAVDVSRMYLVRSQLQSAVDSGALAATMQLRQDREDVDAAVAAAERFVQLNRVGWLTTVPEDAIVVEAGVWDKDTRIFSKGGEKLNAVQVASRLENEPLFFASVLGHTRFAVPRSAVAQIGGNKLDIIMTLDLTASMKQEKRIEALQNAAPLFVHVIEDVGDDDRIGVMGYGAIASEYDPQSQGHSGVPYLLAPQSLYPPKDDWVGVLEAPLTNNFDSLLNGALSPSELIAGKYNGWTPIGAALRDSGHYLNANARNDVDKVIVLMSDGHANKPEGNGRGYAIDMARYVASLKIRIYTISLGSAADEKLMDDIASIGSGKHFVARGSSASELTAKLEEAFRHVAGEIKRTQLVQ